MGRAREVHFAWSNGGETHHCDGKQTDKAGPDGRQLCREGTSAIGNTPHESHADLVTVPGVHPRTDARRLSYLAAAAIGCGIARRGARWRAFTWSGPSRSGSSARDRSTIHLDLTEHLYKQVTATT